MHTICINKSFVTVSEDGSDILIDIFGAPESVIDDIKESFGIDINQSPLDSFTEDEIRSYVKDKFCVEDWVHIDADPECYWR